MDESAWFACLVVIIRYWRADWRRDTLYACTQEKFCLGEHAALQVLPTQNLDENDTDVLDVDSHMVNLTFISRVALSNIPNLALNRFPIYSTV
eukprot:4609179-Pyramimonas_sp.AAC.2